MKSRNFRGCFLEMQWRCFHSAPKIPATTLLTFFYLTYSTFQSVCRIQQGPSLMFFKWLTKSLIRYGVCANNLHKRIKSHLANIVEPLQSSWTDGNRFAWLDCRLLDRARWFLLYWHLHFQNVILKLLELIHNMFIICLRAEVFILTASLWGFV